MPDISMCMNEDCIKKDTCYRHTALPSEYRQAYAMFTPENNTKENFNCKYYYDNLPNKSNNESRSS